MATWKLIDVKCRNRSRHSYTSQQLVALVLFIRHCQQNNALVRLLSAPNVEITIPPRLVHLRETMIVNTMTKIAEREDAYIPPKIERVVWVSSHIDKFDKQVQIFDEKDTRIRNHNDLVCKWTLDHLANVALKWLSCVVSTYLYGAFDCMLLSCHIRDSNPQPLSS